MSKSLGNFFTLGFIGLKALPTRNPLPAADRPLSETFNFTLEGLQGARACAHAH